jgi:hypothetical protein
VLAQAAKERVGTMQLLSKRAGVVSAVIAGAAAVTAIAASGVGLAATASPAAPKTAVIVDCSGAHVRPATFNRLCGDGSDYITGMHWVSWKTVAYGSGTEHVNDCNPSCARGKIYTYPVLLTAWRALARPHHPGQLYFSRLTEIHSGSLSRPHAARLPLTFTWHLSPSSS